MPFHFPQCPSCPYSSFSPTPSLFSGFFSKDLYYLFNQHLHTSYNGQASSSQVLQMPIIAPISQKQTSLAQRGEAALPESPASKWPRQNSKAGCLCSVYLLYLSSSSPGKSSVSGYSLFSQGHLIEVFPHSRNPKGYCQCGSQAPSVQLRGRFESLPAAPWEPPCKHVFITPERHPWQGHRGDLSHSDCQLNPGTLLTLKINK